MAEEVYVGFGSNQGDKAGFLREALQRLKNDPKNRDFVCSSLWETLPWGTSGQDMFLNGAARFLTDYEPLALLRRMQEIEHSLGRVRPYRWAPRTVDLDLLLYGEQIIRSPELTVPHPLMMERLFVLVPLAEIAPELILPDGTPVAEPIAELKAREPEAFAAMAKTGEKW